MVGNQKVVKAFQHESINEESLMKSMIVYLRVVLNHNSRCTCRILLHVFVDAIVYDTVCIYGAFSVIGGSLTVGGLSSFLTYANQYTKPFNDISNVFTELEASFSLC